MRTAATFEMQQGLGRLAQRYPYVLIDQIIELDAARTRIRAIKHFSLTEPYFVGHFPGNPVVPGVLQMMAITQAGELARGGEPVKLLRAKRFHFRSPVLPGDALTIELTSVAEQDGEWTVRASGAVGGEVRVSGTLVLGTFHFEHGRDRREANG